MFARQHGLPDMEVVTNQDVMLTGIKVLNTTIHIIMYISLSASVCHVLHCIVSRVSTNTAEQIPSRLFQKTF